MIMGNETSHLSGLEINEKATEITDFWAHYQATVNDSGYFFNLKGHGSISVFKSEAPVLGPLWTLHSPLEKCAISLMKYRHPSILRYVWHWQQSGVHWLATEPVQPLSQALSTQDSLHICVGLNQILQALEFLHNKASQSHNNVSIGSIYVMADGCWKLGGMEFLRTFPEMNSAYLKETKKHRYDRAVDQNEELADDLTKIDQYAFSTLVDDVLKGRNEDDVPFLREFKMICRSEFQNPVASLRPDLSSLLKHEFFNHEFIAIHKFLTSLPLKCEQDKSKFFCSLIDKLRNFKEETVARQLGGPLLSRMVLLDSTAREKLLPHILVPKAENTAAADKETGLFSLNVFTQHVTPQLLRMFRVRDVQVRLSLLKHFSGYFSTFSREDLTTYVLPELLVGIKDTSDTLVSMTLLCLADLVPILGAATVIGGKRFKLFADGRPLTHPRIKSDSIPHKLKQKIILQTALDKRPESLKSSHQIKTHDREILGQSRIAAESPSNKFVADETSFGSGESIEIESNLFLHERPSPDGGEDLDSEVMVNTVEEDVEGSDGNWSDWNENENRENVVFESEFDIKGLAIARAQDFVDVGEAFDFNNLANIKTALTSNDLQGTNITNNEIKETAMKNSKNDSLYLQKAAMDAKSRKLTDISELDIKNQKFKVSNLQNSSANRDEFNFFTDMEPVIEKTSTFLVNEKMELNNELGFNNIKSNENLDYEMPQTISLKLSFAPLESEELKAGDEAWGSGGWEDV